MTVCRAIDSKVIHKIHIYAFDLSIPCVFVYKSVQKLKFDGLRSG